MLIEVNFEKVSEVSKRRFAQAKIEKVSGNQYRVTLHDRDGFRRILSVTYDIKKGSEMGLLAHAIKESEKRDRK